MVTQPKMQLILAVATVLAALPVFDWLRSVWRRGPGARHNCQRAVETLSVGTTRERFEEILAMGSPTHKATNDTLFTARLFQNEWCGVQVVADENDVVHRFAVWPNHKKFRPALRLGGQWPRLDVVLQRTPLAHLGGLRIIRAGVGAQTAHYLEEHYFGRPGHYRYYQIGFTEDSIEGAILPNDCQRVLVDYSLPDDSMPDEIVDFRNMNKVNTYGESLSPISDDRFPFGATRVEAWAVRRRVDRTDRRFDRKFRREDRRART
jgi:hypothetical protein